MQAGFWGAEQLGPVLLHLQGLADTSGPSPISGIPVTILLGFALRNNGLIKLPMERLKAGLELSKGTLLRAGIICIGAKLSLVEIANVGLQGVPAVMAAIGTGMLVVPRLGRAMGLSTKLSSLVAAGTSICGVTAISALSPTIRASEQETAVAVANVVAFGTLNMLLMPHVAHALFASSTQAGAFLGLSVHDTAQKGTRVKRINSFLDLSPSSTHLAPPWALCLP
ncbi:uncharacterized protein MONBRDRAFT_28203 [Monosiga brevicollis MX1]|uniref:Sulfate exporter family transporter n=1 Tax=Monosiga brevicollis TaxID=81824 RepID=A9V7H9_MONBE|nr:uncharacterized protein MONBRDRAFT_28203 [Monosiga brevicollis MX1]EDQ86589.1 predicted protein [Monosiga brevicollis MX1]|eukprot:XP_001748702.1 hypothetical protein [Monosiga brevicollis MX1]